MAQAGPAPHEAETGKIVAFSPGSSTAAEVASGAKLNVDVEAGRGRTLYALSQGEWNGVGEGSPAIPNDGTLLQVDGDGGFTEVWGGLDRPTSMEIINNDAYIISMAGQIWVISDVAGPPFGN
jgi:hypothetical protein